MCKGKTNTCLVFFPFFFAPFPKMKIGYSTKYSLWNDDSVSDWSGVKIAQFSEDMVIVNNGSDYDHVSVTHISLVL